MIIAAIYPPDTEGWADASMGGTIYDKACFTGGFIMMNGTAVICVCKKQVTLSLNTTEAELYATLHLGKIIIWVRQFMEDLGIPYTSEIPLATDNNSNRLIGQGRRLTRNVRHIAIQSTALQEMVQFGTMALRAVGSEDNRADHCTKALPASGVLEHAGYALGLRFLTLLHAKETKKRNEE